jgi:tetratricopeptide (TPR) repeat protein
MLRKVGLALCSAFVLVSFFVVCTAQENHQHEHGADEKIGQVHFATACDSAQDEFDRAVAMLHSFWYEKASEAFSEIARRHPSCAMAHWGVAMTFYHPLWERPNAEALKNGWAAVEKAKAVGAKAPRESDYIAAIESFYKDYATTAHLTRVLAYEKAMEQLHSRYLDDREASVFYALALVASAQALPTDKTYSREKRAAAMLNDVLSKEPQHPGVAHYLIHAYDSPPLAHLALNAARSYAKIAPSVPHALHMPSHIFTRLGLWQESIQSNLASEAAAKRYAAETHMDGAWDEQLHAMDYLMYAYLQGAQDKQARGVLDELYQIRKTTPQNFKVAYAFAAIPARYALERRQWAEAAQLKLHPADLAWNRTPWAESVIHFARGVGAARTGDVAVARQSIDRLTALEALLTEAKERNQVAVQRLTVSAWVAQAEGKREEAVKLMRSAADLEDTTEKHPVTPGPVVPAREMLGDLLSESKQPAQALKEYEAALVVAPNRFGSLLGAARAAKAAGHAEKARGFYAKLMTICNSADSKRVELEEARSFLQGNPSRGQ